jgi:hypothetical protein
MSLVDHSGLLFPTLLLLLMVRVLKGITGLISISSMLVLLLSRLMLRTAKKPEKEIEWMYRFYDKEKQDMQFILDETEHRSGIARL